MPDLDQIKQGEQGCRTGAGVRQGPVGQSRGPAARLPRSRQPRCPVAARRRGRGADPQGRRADTSRMPDGNAALPRTHPAAVLRTDGEVRLAANR